MEVRPFVMVFVWVRGSAAYFGATRSTRPLSLSVAT